MIKKYVVIMSLILVILMFTSIGSASFLSSRTKIYERFQENSIFRKVLDRLTQSISQNSNIASINTGENDEDDDLIDQDGPDEDVLLPDVIDVVGEVTPDNGDEVVTEEDDLGETPTIDINGPEGTTLNDEPTVNQDGENGRTLERVIEIVTENNEIFGAMLEKVVERTFAPGTTESNGIAEAIIDTVVVVGESTGTAGSTIADNVVLTADDL